MQSGSVDTPEDLKNAIPLRVLYGSLSYQTPMQSMPLKPALMPLLNPPLMFSFIYWSYFNPAPFSIQILLHHPWPLKLLQNVPLPRLLRCRTVSAPK
jgi:hypothetical protein